MRKWVLLVLIFTIFTGCDDGDTIVTDFEFDNKSDLKRCQNGSTNVFYIINTDPDESISFSFEDEDFDGIIEDKDKDEQTKTVDVNDNNEIIYRTYDDKVNGRDYFCSGTPPTKPNVTDEYTSKDGGEIEIVTQLIDREEETDPEGNVMIKRIFETFVIAHNITLERRDKEETIVQETLHLGSFQVTDETDADDVEENTD